ncbi:MAG: T9SS type A sorting domain-containing protein, partial [Gracilimonas sp.]
EIPDVRIAKVVNTVDSPGYIEILNMEEIMVSLSGWSLTSKNETITFLDDVKLYPGDAIKWLDTSDIDENDTANNNTVYSELDNPLLQSNGGSVSLRDRQGKMISEVKYSRAHKPENRETQKEELIVEKKSTQDNYQREQENNQLVSTNIAVLKEAKPGYKAITDQDILNAISPEKELFIWNEELKVFEGVKSSSVTEENNSVIFGYFEADEIKQLADLDESIIVQTNTSENLSFSISATDKNENENIEGLEGLNLIVNNLEIPIPVHKFIELSKAAYPDIELNIVVYGIQQNDLDELIFVKLEPDEYIAPFAPFWVMLESSLEKTIFEIEREALRKEEDIIVEEDFQDVGEQGLIEIVVGSADHEKRLKLHFAEDQLVKQVKNLNAYQELHLPYQSFLNISFNQGDDYFSEIMLSSKISQILTLPVHYSTSESGTLNFKISKWEGIPADWEIQLEDKTTEKKYNLRKDFTFNFDHSVKNINEEDDSENTRSLTDYSVPNRFVIHVNPAVENNEISDEENEKPRDLELHQNFPNPFNPATTISFYLPESEDIKLSVFNIVGQPVAVMAEGRLSAGEHQFEWDATDKPSGMYIYQLEVGKSVMTRKMTLVK